MTESTTKESSSDWKKNTDTPADADAMPECIAERTNIDGTLNYRPLPLAMRNFLLSNNGGETNDVY